MFTMENGMQAGFARLDITPPLGVEIPSEPFCEIGVNIRANAPFPVTCVCCQTNGSYGYFPDAKAYDQGGYESYNTPVVKGSGEVLVKTAQQLLNAIG